MFDHECGRCAEFAAGGKALQHAGHDYDQRRRNTDLRIGRGKDNHCRSDHHDEDRGCQRCFASGPVGIRAEDDGAERTHDERNPESADTQQQGSGFVRRREERLADHNREIAVDQQIIKFECVADAGGANFFPGITRFADR